MRHGGDIGGAIARHGGKRSDWLDLSCGINPRCYPAAAALHPACLGRLPEPADLEALLGAARRFYRVPKDWSVCAAPGTEILIRLLPHCLTGRTALVATSYRSYSESFGADLYSIASPDEAALGDNLIAVRPNNPDGTVVPRAGMLRAAARAVGAGGVVVLDEAYADADESTTMLSGPAGSRTIILKSFGKFFGLPGLRLGFAIGDPHLIDRLRRMLGDWPVSAPALAIGHAALSDVRWQEKSRRWLADQRRRVDDVLIGAGYAPSGDTPLFAFLGDCPAADLHAHLARRHIWTRVFSDRPGAMRLGLPGDEKGLCRLAEALTGARC